MAGRPSGYPEPNWRKIARAITEAGRPLSSIEIADALGVHPERPTQRRQSKVNQWIANTNDFCIRKGGPIFSQAGYGHGPYNNVRYILWGVTDLGREQLALPWPPPPSQTARVISAREQRVAENRARREHLERILPPLVAERGWGPHTGPREREVASRELRPMGLSLQDIASVFGVTREQIRLDLLPPERREVIRKGNIERNRRYARRHYAAHREEILARNRKRKEQAKVRVRAPKGRRRLIFRSGMLADMDTVTFTEW